MTNEKDDKNNQNIDNLDDIDIDTYDDLIIIYPFDPDVEEGVVFTELTKIFTQLKGKEKKIAHSLCRELASVIVDMRISKWEYRRMGLVEEMQQGTYSVRRTNVSFTNYLSLLKEYKSLHKQILDLYPKEILDDKEKMNGLLAFMKKYS